MPQTMVSHYSILGEVGSGGMGVVYRAEDSRLKRTVALKFLPQGMSRDAQASERFLREARAASALDHPNICTIHEVGQAEDGQLFICMAYYEGETLDRKIARGPLAVEEAVGLALQIARGLAEAHAHSIVHRDVKPSNIFITRGGVAKILDFGLAKLHNESVLTRVGTTIGTTAYMAPEQIQGEEADERADLWALGVVLFEMLAGSRPFPGDHPAAVMYEILNAEPQPVGPHRQDIPDQLRGLLAGLLTKDPTRRIGSAQSVIDSLQHPVAPEPAKPLERSLAVLYFENMSSERENDYFCAGMADDIITDLSRIRDLKVRSRTDVLPFKNKEVNTREVGHVLHVNYILQGSVRKAGPKVRITAQLVDVATGYQVWAERFDRMLEDIFDVQNEVSSNIVKALKGSLTETERQVLAQKPTDDLRAHDFYLRALDLLNRRGRKNVLSAIQMFQHALALDNNYVAAYTGLAEAYSAMFMYYDGDHKYLAKIVEASEQALSLDPSAVEAQFGIAMVYFQQRRHKEARTALESLIARHPDHYDANRWLGIISDLLKEYDTALQYYRRCAELKPFSEEPWMHIDMTCRRKGDLAGAKEAGRRTLEAGEAKLALSPDDTTTLSRVAGYRAQFGQRDRALDALKRVLELDSSDGLALYNCACTYATLGDKQHTLECLRKALATGYFKLREWIKGDPDFAAYREDPEFKVFLAES